MEHVQPGMKMTSATQCGRKERLFMYNISCCYFKIIFPSFFLHFFVKILYTLKMESRSRKTLHSIQDAMTRLRQSAQAINRREGVQPSELKRVREALRITAKPR